MWRIIAVGVVLVGLTTGCSLGGAGGAANTGNSLSENAALVSLNAIHAHGLLSGSANSKLADGLQLRDAGNVHLSWIVVGSYGASLPGAGSPVVGSIQLFGLSSEADASSYAAAHHPQLEPDINGGTFFGSYRNVIVKVGGTPMRSARLELAKVKHALARGGR
jgi:hypothetical protein